MCSPHGLLQGMASVEQLTEIKRLIGEGKTDAANNLLDNLLKRVAPAQKNKKTPQAQEFLLRRPKGPVTVHKLQTAAHDPQMFVNKYLSPLAEYLAAKRKELRSFKVAFVVEAVMKLAKADGTVEEKVEYWRSPVEVATEGGDLKQTTTDLLHQCFLGVDGHKRERSGWTIQLLQSVSIEVISYRPASAGTYIPTPNWVSKKAVVNVRNEDDECLKWALLSALFPVKDNKERVTNYIFKEKELNWTGISFPAENKDIAIFEKNNPAYAVHVWTYIEEKGRQQLIPYRTSKKLGQEICLLLLRGPADGSGLPQGEHYIWVRDPSLIINKKRKPHLTACLRCIANVSDLEEHRRYCLSVAEAGARVVMPTKPYVQFDATLMAKTLKKPFVVYADFEASIVEAPVNTSGLVSTQEANSYCYVVVASDGEATPLRLYRGHLAAKLFVNALLMEYEQWMFGLLKSNRPMHLSAEEETAFQAAQMCCTCQGPFTYNDFKVRHHDHFTGLYLGAAHRTCNLFMKSVTGKIPVVFHNLKGYDSHHIFSELGAEMAPSIDVIPQSGEKYITFSIGPFQFIDSYQFLASSLDALARSLKPEDKRISREMLGEHFELLQQKGVYPYSYVTGHDVFRERELPPIEKFKSDLTEMSISPEDYARAQRVWRELGCTNFGQYHDAYLKVDVLMLADVFENFRVVAMTVYGLDPAHFFSSPGLSWGAMLKLTKVRLELIQDLDMHLFVEKGIRGGISTVGEKRLCEANNPFMDSYDHSKPVSYIMYWDANAQYSWAMSQKLPWGGHKWVYPCGPAFNYSLADWVAHVSQHDAEGDLQYVYEVDLEYPDELHDAHNSYPLAPENRTIPLEMMSDYQLDTARELGIKLVPSPKLMPTLLPKENYVVHGEALKTYLRHGLKLKKVHKVLEFQQSRWLKPFIDLNTSKRMEAAVLKNDFEVNLYKLMNNAIFGKTMEDVRKRLKVKFTSEEDKMIAIASHPTFKNFKMFDGGLAAFHVAQLTCQLNKPVFVGQAVLDISKTLTYEFFYGHLKQKYGGDVTLLYTDTDSLIVEIKSLNVYQDQWEHRDLFDLGEYPEGFFQDKTNAKVPGKFKDEAKGKPITEFIGLSSKMYSYVVAERRDPDEDAVVPRPRGEVKKAKGITRATLNGVTHLNYKQCIYVDCLLQMQQKTMKSVKQRIGVYSNLKVTLSPLDSKRYILDGITSYAYGHKKNTLIKYNDF